MSISGIQGHLLEVTVVGCLKLKDTEWISRQDPYVCLEYANTKFRTRTCTDGGKNPVFQEKYVFTLIEGLREINVVVWNSNTLTFDDFIGSGKVQLQDVLCRGYDDRPWPIQTKTARYAGEVKLIMHYSHASPDHTSSASAPPYPTHQPQTPMYSSAAYPSAPSGYQPPTTPTCHHPPLPSSYPATCTSPYSYPPDPTPSYSSPYPYPPPNNNPSVYPPAAYPTPPSAYPPSPYPPPYPPPTAYPPPTYGSAYPPPGHYNGQYPPPPY